MSAAGFFLLIAIGVGVGAFVLWPVVFSGTKIGQPAADQADQQRGTLQAEREAILETLRTLDFDHQTGKLLDEDYRVQRARLVAYGADILRQIDQLPKPEPVRKNRKSSR